MVQSSLLTIDDKHGEYLAWNDADIWNKTGWNNKKTSLVNNRHWRKMVFGYSDTESEQKINNLADFEIAWQGASWVLFELTKGKEICFFLDLFPDSLSELLFRKAEALAEYHTALCNFYQMEKKENQLLNVKPWQSYIACICEFLPPYKFIDEDEEETLWLPVHTPGGFGEPLLWKGVLDTDIHMLMRQLLMDGWLSLWPDKDGNKLYLQPSSLALLYWAARHSRKPHTSSPRDFIENYDWNEKWFAGRLMEAAE